MSYLLNIETATRNCSVAVARDGEVLSCVELATQGYSHAEKLHVFIDDALRKAGIDYQALSAVAVSKGPGSYTGLRIGVSAAKGLCYALDIPLIAVNTLESLAAQANIAEGIIVPMLDARRMEVYSAIFDKDHQMIRDVMAEIISEDSFASETRNIYILGDCQEKIQTVVRREKIVFLDQVIFPSAKDMSALSFKKFLAEDFEDVAYFEPFYLKDFIGTIPKK